MTFSFASFLPVCVAVAFLSLQAMFSVSKVDCVRSRSVELMSPGAQRSLRLVHEVEDAAVELHERNNKRWKKNLRVAEFD